VKIVGNVLKAEEQSMLTKFDEEYSTEVLEVKLWIDNGNGVFMAERRAACRLALFLATSSLYSPMGKRQNRKRREFRETLHLHMCLYLKNIPLVAVGSEGTYVSLIGLHEAALRVIVFFSWGLSSLSSLARRLPAVPARPQS
jgi:hypothetical protein